MILDQLESAVQMRLGVLKAAAEDKKLAEAELEQTKRNEMLYQHATDFLLQLAVDYQATVIKFLGDLVSLGVSEIFDKDWTVRFDVSQRANQRTLDVILCQPEGEVLVPEGCGGGVSQVIAVLTQVAIVYMMRSTVRQFIILDESLSHLALVYIPKAASVLRNIATQLGIEILLVSHQEELVDCADIIYQISNTDGITNIEVERNGQDESSSPITIS